MFHYQAYGFSIRSDVALPAPEAEGGDAPALAIARTERIDPHGEAIGPFAQAGEDWLAFDISGVVRFHVSRTDGIRYLADPGTDTATVATFLMNSALPCAVMLAGRIALRGTAVSKDDEAVLLIGLPSKGKSSAAAAMIQQGYSILSDGVCAITTEGRLLPGFAAITLPQDAANALALPKDDLVRTRPDSDRWHWIQPAPPHAAPRSVKRIYQLIVHTADRVDVSETRGAERFNMLRACTFRPAEFARFGLQQAMLKAGAILSREARLLRVWRPVRGYSPSLLAERIVADASTTGEQQ